MGDIPFYFFLMTFSLKHLFNTRFFIVSSTFFYVIRSKILFNIFDGIILIIYGFKLLNHYAQN